MSLPLPLSAPLLSVSSLGVQTAAGRALLSDLSFDLAAGQRLGLIGESGSGKSLTSLAVTGLLGAGLSASGSVLLDGVQVVDAPERRLIPLRGRVASIVFQEPLTALDPLMRIGTQVAEPIARHRALRGTALRTAVAEALDEVSLSDARIARSYPYEISGGQRQRAAIAIALASRPQLLIADEPTTALDVTVQAQILQLLDGLVEARGMALLFISHDLAVVSAMTQDVLVMSKGVAVERGPIQQVITHPQHPYTAQLVGSARALDDMLGTR